MKHRQTIGSQKPVGRRDVLKYVALFSAAPLFSLLKLPARASAAMENAFARQQPAPETKKQENKLNDRWCIPH